MKLHELLEETDKLTPIIEKIKENCQPFLSQSKGLPMMRGVSANDAASVPLFSEESVRMDRRPRNSGRQPFFNWTFNAVIQEKFKIPKVRFTSLFCSGSYGSAQYYGVPTFVFPKGNFKYLWSPKINDSYEDIKSLLRHYDSLPSEIKNGGDDTTFSDWKDWEMKIANPFIERLIKENDYEVDSLLKLGDPILDDIHKEIYKDYEQYKMSGFSAALKSRNEIFIIGPQEYYSLNIGKFEEKVHYKTVKDIYGELLRLLSA